MVVFCFLYAEERGKHEMTQYLNFIDLMIMTPHISFFVMLKE